MKTPRLVGKGDFGNIYEGPKKQDAVSYLLEKKGGEVQGAFVHPEISEQIDIVYGKTGEQGYGLAHIQEERPDILSKLADIIKGSKVIQQAKDRILLIKELEDGEHTAVLRLDWDGKNKTWLVTSFRNI